MCGRFTLKTRPEVLAEHVAGPIRPCDMPEADETMVGVMAVMAQRETKLISERTRAALRAAKARGVKLGTDHLTDDDKARGRVPGLATMKAIADTFVHDLAPVVRELREAGRTLREIADHMNAEGFTTRRGGRWSATQVARVLARG